jgi:hypothetical protein
MHVYNPSSWETETEYLKSKTTWAIQQQVQGQLELSQTLSQKTKHTNNKKIN